EPEGLEMFRGRHDRLVRLAENPTVRERERPGREIVDGRYPLRQLRQDEPPDIPQLVREVSPGGERRLEVVRVEDHVGAERAARDRSEEHTSELQSPVVIS